MASRPICVYTRVCCRAAGRDGCHGWTRALCARALGRRRSAVRRAPFDVRGRVGGALPVTRWKTTLEIQTQSNVSPLPTPPAPHRCSRICSHLVRGPAWRPRRGPARSWYCCLVPPMALGGDDGDLIPAASAAVGSRSHLRRAPAVGDGRHLAAPFANEVSGGLARAVPSVQHTRVSEGS